MASFCCGASNSCVAMAKEIKDVKTFLTTLKRPDAKGIIVVKKKLRNGNFVTKFKTRCSRFLYTFVVTNQARANKIEASLPSGLPKKVISTIKK